MNHQLYRKVFLVLGTVTLGALGSGLWEALLKPSLYWLGTLMLDLATLGLSALRDGMYAEAAKGYYERASLMLLAMALGTVTGFAGAIAGFFTAPIFFGRRLLANEEPSPRQLRLFRKSKGILVALFLALLLIVIVQVVRVGYVIRAANYVEQLQRIASPYLTLSEQLRYSSRFAQVTTRREYVVLVEELISIAKKNAAKVPEFDIY